MPDKTANNASLNEWDFRSMMLLILPKNIESVAGWVILSIRKVLFKFTRGFSIVQNWIADKEPVLSLLHLNDDSHFC